jgi:alpha-tubulin suppressor-like RCC1 family protein
VASYDRTCAIVIGGKVYCWGRVAALDPDGRPLGSLLPVKVNGIPKGPHDLSVGVTHACVLDELQATWCWGLNDRGQLGDGTKKPRPGPVKASVDPAAKVVASDGYTCVVLLAGGVSCWGRSHGNYLDPLRNPDGLVNNTSLPRLVPGLETATDVSATGDFACAILPGGNVSCWGENDHGQLANGKTKGRSTPTPVHGIPESVQVVATANHACSLGVDGTVYCWGRGDHGQMGNGSFEDQRAPMLVNLPQPAVKLVGATSGHWTVAFTATGSAFAWGRNDYGQLGSRGSTTDKAVPVAVSLPD